MEGGVYMGEGKRCWIWNSSVKDFAGSAPGHLLQSP